MFKVQKKCCDQCLFTDKRIVSKARAAQVVRDCLKKDTFFNCHKTQVKGIDAEVCCAGFWAAHKHDFNLGRIAQRLKAVQTVDV